MLIYLEPLDTLFFRDSRPFDAGTDAFAESTLPSPLAIYGALGSYILEERGKSFAEFYLTGQDDVLGKYDPTLNTGKLNIKGIFLSRGEELFFPAPANLFTGNERASRSTLLVQKPHSSPWFYSDLPDSISPIAIPSSKGEDVKQVNGFINFPTLIDFRGDNLHEKNSQMYQRDRLFSSELRYGIGINETTLAVKEGYLYGASHLRFRQEKENLQKTGIAILVNDIPQITEGVVSLGGEKRRAKLSLGDDRRVNLPYDALVQQMQQSQRFFLYFLTPCILHNGWTLKDKGPLKGATLVAAAVNKPGYLSGWQRTSHASGEPRPMRKSIPAGSVYFFKAPSDWDYADTCNRIQNNSLSDEYQFAGFGMAAMGVW